MQNMALNLLPLYKMVHQVAPDTETIKPPEITSKNFALFKLHKPPLLYFLGFLLQKV